MVDHALAWARRGFPVFPLREGGKKPLIEDWQRLATSDPETIRQVWGKRRFNVGVLPRGHIVVDIDDKNGKTGSLDWELFGYPDDTLTVETPSGGRHLYYRSDHPTRQSPLTRSIDIRAGDLGYAIAPGSMVDGKPYTLLADKPVADAPETLAAHCHRKVVERADLDVELDTEEAEQRARDWLEQRAPAVEGEHGDLWTYKTACGVIDLGISAELCFDLMLDWNDRCSPPWELEALQEKVDSAWRNRLNPVGSQSIEADFGSVLIPAPELKPVVRPKFLWLGDKSLDLSQQWLIYNRFPKVGTAALVGPSNGGKTFLALDLGACLGSGAPWLGSTSDERVGTIILTAEGIGGLPARMAGYDEHGPVVATTVRLIKDNPNEVTETLQEAAALLRAKGVRVGLIVLDTLTASGLLENENDNSEIGRALNYLEQMAMAFQCLVLVTHHPPKQGSGMRGGYALHAGFDVVVEIFQQGNQRFVECSKNRDGPAGAWGSFILSPHTIIEDFTGKGRDITTQRVIYGTEVRDSTRLKEPSTDRLAIFFGCFEDVRAELKLTADAPIPLEKLKERFAELVRNRKGNPVKSLRECLEWSKNMRRVNIINDLGEDFIAESENRVGV